MMFPASIDNLDDGRLDPYRELKKTNFTRMAHFFIAEGRLVTQRLLSSSYSVESILVARSKWSSMEAYVREDTEVLLVDDQLVDQLVGFKFHSGVMGCGRRVKQKSIDAVMNGDTNQRKTLVAVPETALAENLGSLIRVSASFGCHAIIVGNRSADAFSRRVIRVSMGNIFSIPIIEPDNFEKEIGRIRTDFDCEVIAATLDPAAEPLPSANRSTHACLMFGNEALGLSQGHVELADRQVTLEMHAGIDSLNVANAASVFIYHFTRIC